MSKFNDITGQRFGRLVALNREGREGRWLCRCDCGKEKTIYGYSLRSGGTRSCGCLFLEMVKTKGRGTIHGKCFTRTYHSWRSMKNRCENINCKAYDRYGGRGIKVCKRWGDFKNFFEDMGECPDGMSIDRIDNNRGYEPNNCRWATTDEQIKNRRKFCSLAKFSTEELVEELRRRSIFMVPSSV